MSKRLPPANKGRRLNVFYVTQLQTYPPTIGLFVNHPDLFDNNYERFMINKMRDELPFSEVPIKLLVRGRKEMPEK
jgi:GTP-binding protein